MSHIARRGVNLLIATVACSMTLLAIGCSGSGSAPTSQPNANFNNNATAASAKRVSATIVISSGKLPASARRATYISPSIAGLSIVVTPAGGAATAPVLADLSLTSTACSLAADTSRTCTVALQIPVGTASLAISTYDAKPANNAPAGKLLSTATVAATISASAANVIPLALNGVATTLSLALGGTLQLGQSGSVPVVVNAQDADGNTIIGADPFATPITLTNTDTSGATTLSTTTVNAPSTVVTLAYTGAILPLATIGAASGTIGGGSVNFRPQGYLAPTGSTASYAVGETTTTTVVTPYPTFSPYATGNVPPNNVVTQPNDIAVAQSASATFTPMPDPAPSATPAFAAIQNLLLTSRVRNPIGTTEISDVENQYSSYKIDGTSVDLLRYGFARHRGYIFPGALNGPSDSYQGEYYLKPRIVAKFPLVSGQAWTNDATTIKVANLINTQKSFYSGSDNSTFANDGSFTRNVYHFYPVGSTLNNGQAGTDSYIQVGKADGSGSETDTYAYGSVETDTVGAPSGGKIVAGFSITPDNVSGSNAFPDWLTPLGGQTRTDTFVTGAPVALDSQCGLSAPVTVVPITETLRVTRAYFGTNEVKTTVSYLQPGVGTICTVTTDQTDSYAFYFVKNTLDPVTGATVGKYYEVGFQAQPVTTTIDQAVESLTLGTTVASTKRIVDTVGSALPVTITGDPLIDRATLHNASRKATAR